MIWASSMARPRVGRPPSVERHGADRPWAGPGRGLLLSALLLGLGVLPLSISSGGPSVVLHGAAEHAERPPSIPPGPLANDTTPPTISIISPAAGAASRTFEVRVEGVAADDVRVASVELSTDGTGWYDARGTTAWTGSALLREGETTIFARAFDLAGNNATSSVHVVLDLEPARTAGRLAASVGLVVTGIALAVILRAGRRPPAP